MNVNSSHAPVRFQPFVGMAQGRSDKRAKSFVATLDDGEAAWLAQERSEPTRLSRVVAEPRMINRRIRATGRVDQPVSGWFGQPFQPTQQCFHLRLLDLLQLVENRTRRLGSILGQFLIRYLAALNGFYRSRPGAGRADEASQCPKIVRRAENGTKRH